MYTRGPRFCSTATAMGRAVKRWCNSMAQRSTASGVFFKIPFWTFPPVAGRRDQACCLEPQSMAANAAQSGSPGEEQIEVDITLPSQRGWLGSGESLIVALEQRASEYSFQEPCASRRRKRSAKASIARR